MNPTLADADREFVISRHMAREEDVREYVLGQIGSPCNRCPNGIIEQGWSRGVAPRFIARCRAVECIEKANKNNEIQDAHQHPEFGIFS